MGKEWGRRKRSRGKFICSGGFSTLVMSLALSANVALNAQPDITVALMVLALNELDTLSA